MGIAEEIRATSDIDDLRESLRRTQAQLAKAKARADEMVQAVRDAVSDAIRTAGPLRPTPAPRIAWGSGRPEIALWDTGDWQLAKVTPSYDSAVAKRRTEEYAAKCVRLTGIQRKDHPVRDAVLVFGGDIIEGLFNFPSQPFEIDATLFAQWENAGRMISAMVRTALAAYQKVHVVPEWGNHGRIGSKRDAVPRSDNVDRMAYEYARALLADEKRLTWQACPEDIQRLEIGEYRALVIHGDEIGRNGFASPTTVVQHVNRWRSGAYPWPFRDVYMHHYHTHAEWPLANGEGCVYQTGSTESDNRYAREQMAASARPSQRLHFVDACKGRVTAQYKVHLN